MIKDKSFMRLSRGLPGKTAFVKYPNGFRDQEKESRINFDAATFRHNAMLQQAIPGS